MNTRTHIQFSSMRLALTLVLLLTALGAFPTTPTLATASSLTWNTFLGGSGTDTGLNIAVDGSGNIYVVGSSTATWGSPVRAFIGNDDVFAAKLDSSGNLIWHTFLGGSGHDYGYAIAVDGIGNTYVAGQSSATWGSPKRAYTSSSDAFAAKLDSNGNLTWNTFLGGSGLDYGNGIDVDGSRNVYVAGTSDATWGTSPVRAYTGFQEAFAVKLDSSGNLTWHTFLGGSNLDHGGGIAVDGSGNVHVGGHSYATWGSPVQTFAGSSDAFASKLNSSGNLTWNTFLGGSDVEYGHAIAIDGSGNVYVAGYSDATWGSPVRAYTSLNDAFAAKLDSSGNLTWNTFLGGSSHDESHAIAADGNGNVYVSGFSRATWGSPERAFTRSVDSFAVRLDGSGILTWHTFLGGTGTDYGYGVAADGSGENAYVAGYSDVTWGSPVRAHTNYPDAFAVRCTLPDPWRYIHLPLVVRNY